MPAVGEAAVNPPRLSHLVAIRSRQDHVQHLRRLMGRRGARRDAGVVVVEGPHAIDEVSRSGAVVHTVFLVRSTDLPDEVVALAERMQTLGAEVVELTGRELAAIADTVTPQPILAVVTSPEVALDAAVSAIAAHGLGLVGVDVRDPGNVGTIIRSAESAGAGAVIWCNGCADATSPKVVRSSAGALFHVPTAVDAGEPAAVFSALRAAGVRLLGTSADRSDAIALDDVELDGPSVFVLSNEAHGLDADTSALLDGFVTIPTAGRTESLNVAMAATVLVFEAARRRRASAPGER